VILFNSSPSRHHKILSRTGPCPLPLDRSLETRETRAKGGDGTQRECVFHWWHQDLNLGRLCLLPLHYSDQPRIYRAHNCASTIGEGWWCLGLWAWVDVQLKHHAWCTRRCFISTCPWNFGANCRARCTARCFTSDGLPFTLLRQPPSQLGYVSNFGFATFPPFSLFPSYTLF
jgi:hypothetical protein